MFTVCQALGAVSSLWGRYMTASETGSDYDVFDEVVWEVTLGQYAGDEVGIKLPVHRGDG